MGRRTWGLQTLQTGMATQLTWTNSLPLQLSLSPMLWSSAEWVWIIFTHSSSWIFSALVLAPFTLQSGAAVPHLCKSRAALASPLQELNCSYCTTERANKMQYLHPCKSRDEEKKALQLNLNSHLEHDLAKGRTFHCKVLLATSCLYSIQARAEQRCRKEEALQLNLG